MGMQWYSAAQVAKQRGVVTATIIGLIDDCELEAVNVARRGAKRRRWRISDAMLAAFDERRANKTTSAASATLETKSSRRTIQRPTKDFFSTQNAGGSK
jgi:hypothetical protein